MGSWDFSYIYIYVYYISGQRNVFKHYSFSVVVCPVIITKFCLRCENMNLYRRKKNCLFTTKSTCPNSVVCKAHLFTTISFAFIEKILTSNGGQYLQIMWNTSWVGWALNVVVQKSDHHTSFGYVKTWGPHCWGNFQRICR